MMKATGIVAPAYKCSGCGYMSLVKTHVDNHIHTKCTGASVIKEEKLVKHHDLEYTCDDMATLHQCSGCGYTSVQATSVKTHVRNKCKTATVLSGKRKLVFGDVPPPQIGNVAASRDAFVSNSGNVNIDNSSVNLMLVIVANSKEEYDERLKIFYKVSKENGLTFEKGEFVPSAILDCMEKENPALDNKQFTNNSIVCLKTGKKTPVVQYAKQELESMLSLMVDTLIKYEKPDDVSEEDEEAFLQGMIDTVIHPKQWAIWKSTTCGQGNYDFWAVRDKLARILSVDAIRERRSFYSDFYLMALDLVSAKLCDIQLECGKKDSKDEKDERKKEVYESVQATLKDIASHLKTKKLYASRGRPAQTVAS
jgi:hypothetical protein